MLNVIVVSDDTHEVIGSNCALSHNHLTGALDFANDNVILLNGDRCTAAELESSITELNGGKFILATFSHGCEDALVSTAELTGYVHQGNAYFFGSSVVYTNSCYAGVKLKQHLIDAGCLGYVGYNDEVRLPENESDQLLFISCENSGLIHLLSTQESLTESIHVMMTKYQQQYNKFVEAEEFVLAGLMRHNMDSLTFYDKGATNRAALES